MADTTVTDVATGGRSGIGATPLAMSVLNFDPTLGCDSATFQPCSERALAGLEFFTRIYRDHFPINRRIPKDQPILLGDFPEDQVLDGGVSSYQHLPVSEYQLNLFLAPILCDVQFRRATI